MLKYTSDFEFKLACKIVKKVKFIIIIIIIAFI